VRVDGFLDSGDFRHHDLVNGQAAGRIDDHQIQSLFLGKVDSVFGYLNRLLIVGLHIDRYAYLFTQHPQLLDGSGSVYVAGDQQRVFAPFGTQHVGQLAGEGGFTRTLQP